MKVVEFRKNGFVFTVIGDELIVTLELGFDEVTIYRGPWRDLRPPPEWVEAFWEGIGPLGYLTYRSRPPRGSLDFEDSRPTI